MIVRTAHGRSRAEFQWGDPRPKAKASLATHNHLHGRYVMYFATSCVAACAGGAITFSSLPFIPLHRPRVRLPWENYQVPQIAHKRPNFLAPKTAYRRPKEQAGY